MEPAAHLFKYKLKLKSVVSRQNFRADSVDQLWVFFLYGALMSVLKLLLMNRCVRTLALMDPLKFLLATL